jgi:RimJ/RimL family protein N-acetyltransferase
VQNPFLIGRSVYLRSLEKEDAPPLVRWLNDPEVNRLLLPRRPLNLAMEQEYLQHVNQSDTDLALGIVVLQTDQLIGATGFHEIDFRCRHASFGIVLGDKSAWGKGYGTEATRLLLGYAFESLNLNRVWLHVYEYNARALRVYDKLGFRREGVLRQHTYRDGRYWDTITMGILRDEWEQTRQPR